jgi:hypothetical protein
VIEHREGRSSRWLRGNRLRVALLVALVETLLILTDVIGWRWAVIAAAIVFAFHWFYGRRASREWIRQLSWTAVLAQLLPLLVPIVALAVSFALALALVAVAVVVLAYLLLGLGRRLR